MIRCQEGGLGWLGLAAYVVAWDAWALRRGRETLSSAFGRGLDTKAGRLALGAVWGLVTAHLFGRYVPERLHRFDVISAAARKVERVR